MAQSVAKRIVQVLNLGRMGFMAAYDLQMRNARQHLDELAGHPSAIGRDTLLIVEHNPVYTTGLRRADYGPEVERKLKSVGAEFYTTNRGGLITFHGPGQLVAYPILNLQHFHPSMKWYIAALEQTLISTCKNYGIAARTTEHTGVWVNDRKIGAIGVHGSRYVTTHGLSLNCDTDLTWYKHIVPCGIPGKEATSLSKELNKPVGVKEALVPFLKAFEESFECEIEYSLLEAHDLQALLSQQKMTTSQAGNKVHSVRQMSTLAQPGTKPFKAMW